MVQVVLPNDANPLGFILGGTVMHLIDIAGAIACHRHTRTLLVTAAVDGLQFLHPIKVGDLIILLTLFLLFAELIKSTYTTASSLIDHGLSMVVFIACIVEFLLAPLAATSTFFLIMVATAIDVVAGFTIGIRVARRDLAIGGSMD